MRFTTGTKQIDADFFTVKRQKDENLEMNYDVEIGEILTKDRVSGKLVYLYHNVPAEEIKIGENVYKRNGEFLGYRAE